MYDTYSSSVGTGKALLEGASHLLAGVPAALGYVLLAPYIKARFSQRLRAKLEKEA